MPYSNMLISRQYGKQCDSLYSNHIARQALSMVGQQARRALVTARAAEGQATGRPAGQARGQAPPTPPCEGSEQPAV